MLELLSLIYMYDIIIKPPPPHATIMFLLYSTRLLDQINKNSCKAR